MTTESTFVPQASPRRKSGVSVGFRLHSINSVLLVALVVVSLVAWSALNSQQISTTAVVALSRAQRLHQNADMMHEALQADVYQTLLLPELHSVSPAGVAESVKAHSARLRADLAGIEQLGLLEQVAIDVAGIRPKVENYIAMASTLTELAVTNRDAALKELPAFDGLFHDLEGSMEAATTNMAAAIDAAERRSLSRSVEAKNWLALTGLLAMLVSSGLVVLLGWSIRTGVRQIRDAATQLAAGDLSARSKISSNDDFGEISQALNQMAARLQGLFGQLRSDAERDAYGKQLADALEMSDTEAEVCAVVARAMNVVSPDTPMELLVADSSRAHLEKATAHPLAGAPGCGVESPFSCAAVRRAQTMVFPDSETLNACPRLQDRPGGPTAAVCVPVSFMGRSLGVVHAATPIEFPLTPAQVIQLTALGAQAGMRIGTVRAFERSQLQANTDSLTGLSNRRALEARVRTLRLEDRPYGFILADLDHFKKLNDTQGHEAGDRCLRIYADVLRRSLRPGDLAARWGGEEFCLLLPDATAAGARDVAERVRQELAAAVAMAGTSRLTCSFGVADSTMAGNFETVVRIADDALYQSKENGRDRSTIGSSGQLSPLVPRRDVDPDQSAVMRLDLLAR